MTFNFRWLHALLACLCFALVPLALAQSYPNKPVRLIVPFPPGLGVEPDLARLAPYLAAHH